MRERSRARASERERERGKENQREEKTLGETHRDTDRMSRYSVCRNVKLV